MHDGIGHMTHPQADIPKADTSPPMVTAQVVRILTLVVPNQKLHAALSANIYKNHNCAEMPKIAVHLKIGTHLPFQFSLCYYHKNEKKSKPSKILHKAPIVHTFLWYSST